jgi:hypothetical protein
MENFIEELFRLVLVETGTFYEKLKDECEKEKQMFLNRIETEE